MPNAMYEKLVDFDRLALYDEKIKQLLAGKADSADIPADLSDLTNTGADPYATEGYVDAHGGKIDSISVNGTAQTIDANKNVDLTIPTKVSDLQNDGDGTQGSSFATTSDVDGAIADALEDITGVSFEIVQALPQTGEPGVIYLISDPDGVSPDVYAEYIYVNNAFEKIGTTGSIDLTGYVQTSDITLATNSDVNGLFA